MNSEESFEDWKPLLRHIMENRHYKQLCEYQQKAIEHLQIRIKGLEFELEISKRKIDENRGMGDSL